MMAMLVLAYTLNFVDRQIIGILAEPIKADLKLTDAELGWMGGTAFALFYTALAIPLAMLADRKDRSWIIAIGLALWSAATAACGLAANFWQLFAARMSVGIGEAAGVAPAYSLITDYYPPQRRARALAIFSLGIPLGGAAGVLFGGLIAARIDWRYAFLIIGLLGVLFAPLFKFIVRDPGHGRSEEGPRVAAPALGLVFRTIASKPAFWLLSFGAGTASLVSYGLAFWIPSILARSYGLDLTERSLLFAAILLIGGATGIWLGGVAGDRLGNAHPRGYALVPAVAFAITLPAYLLAFSTQTLWLSSLLFLVPGALGLMWIGPVVTAITRLVPPEMRATAAALYLFILNLIGLGLGSTVIGAISDALTVRFGDEALRYSAMATTSLYALAALLMWLASRRLSRDLEPSLSPA
ncbi:MAG: MFS transporter [Sphingomonas sp.]|uniref:spinster family MFS transporter n=1 Tax=Sphingomonas sp. TaxID=28214 RepID=UPI0017B135A2|nr:MFS transporter [Sphingomonas sp.]MBA3667115.1 MFS transporter [Sphingomonas sp.]